MAGIGRKMPITMFAFLVASLSIIGLPPLGGLWGKWLLSLGALDAGYSIVVGVLMLSSLLNVAYLLPIVARAFFLPTPGEQETAGTARGEAPLPCVIALSTTALLCVFLFFQAGRLQTLLQELFAAR
jgi:multicomponent Na+:H+ antiporter subunit D